MTKIFIVPFKVTPLDGSIMPPDLRGAYVSCYVAGETYVDATENALKKLSSDGLYPEEILQPIHQMDSDQWAIHILDSWPDYVGNLPSQHEFDELIQKGFVVYGPFGSYS